MNSLNFSCKPQFYLNSCHWLLGRGDGSQRNTPIQKEVRDHSTLQANITRDPASYFEKIMICPLLHTAAAWIVLLKLKLNIFLVSINCFLSSCNLKFWKCCYVTLGQTCCTMFVNLRSTHKSSLSDDQSVSMSVMWVDVNWWPNDQTHDA